MKCKRVEPTTAGARCVTCRTNVRATGRRECWRCSHKRWAERHPRTAGFWALKSSARKRGISFTLTREEFDLFCDATSWDYLKGTGPDDLTVDRIDPRRGYSFDNIRAISHAQNSRENSAKKRLLTLRQFAHTFSA